MLHELCRSRLCSLPPLRTVGSEPPQNYLKAFTPLLLQWGGEALCGEKKHRAGAIAEEQRSLKKSCTVHGPVVLRAVQGCGPRFPAPGGRWQLERPELRDSIAQRVLPHGTTPDRLRFSSVPQRFIASGPLTHSSYMEKASRSGGVLFSLRGSVSSLRSVPCTAPNSWSLLQPHGKQTELRAGFSEIVYLLD